MIRPSLVLSLLSSIAVGCSGSGFEDENNDSQDVDGKPGEASAGKFWLFDTAETDSCGGLDGIGVELHEIEVTVADNGDFSISGDEENVSCKPSKIGFDCAVETVELKLAGITTRIDASMHVKWTSADRFEGTLSIDSTCTGEACAAIAQELGGENPCFREERVVGVRRMPESFAPESVPLTATLTPMITTCAAAPDVALTQSLRIEPAVNGVDDARIFVDEDPTPHDCSFTGEGRVGCFRLTFDGDVKQFAQVSGSWTSATSFEGEASLELSCDDGKDCTGNAIGLPCIAYYQFKASGKPAGAQ